VSLDRIATFLKEDEVSDQVSTLKRGDSGMPDDGDDDGLGIENGSFKWNEVEETDEERKNNEVKRTDNDNGATLGPEVEEESRFELRDIHVTFPEGQLSLITGPTASGKTALLVTTTRADILTALMRCFTIDGIALRDDITSWWTNNHVEELFQS